MLKCESAVFVLTICNKLWRYWAEEFGCGNNQLKILKHWLIGIISRRHESYALTFSL